MSATDELLSNNEAYAAGFAAGGLPPRPARRVAVLTCMDARLDPARALGLREGDAHVVRNAGGLVTEDAIRSLAVSQALLGTEEILVIHHTDCGMRTLPDEDVRARVQAAAGARPDWPAVAFGEVEEDVRAAVAALRESPLLARRERVRGFVYEVETGRLREVG